MGCILGHRLNALPEIPRYRFLDSDRAWDRYLAAGLGNVYEMAVHGNHAPDNARPVMYIDLFYPIFIIVLLWLLQRQRHEESGERKRVPEYPVFHSLCGIPTSDRIIFCVSFGVPLVFTWYTVVRFKSSWT